MAEDSKIVAVAPTCQGCFGLTDRQTPFTWYSAPMDRVGCNSVEDKLCILGTPWAALLNRLHAAYSYCTNCDFHKGRALLVECYLPLLPLAFFDTGCTIIQEHREALRHVLDASWAAMGQLQSTAKHQHGVPDASWRAFTNTITPFRKLDRKQQAAVLAIRGSIESDPDLLRQAISRNPDEGEWHYKLGYLLEEQRGHPPGCKPPTKEELSTLRRGLKLRVNPDTLTRLARSLSGTGPAGVAEAIDLMEEAMRRFPDNSRVLWLYGIMSSHLYSGRDRAPPGRSGMELVKRCLDAVGGRCAYVLFKLGIMSMCDNAAGGFRNKATVDYFDRALAVNHDATVAAQMEITGLGERCKQERDEEQAKRRGRRN